MKIEISEVANLPSRFGTFKIQSFKEGIKEHLVVFKEPLGEIPLVRVHSECLTGDSMGSLKCDCRDQLEFALTTIEKQGGMVIYLRQEGRGIGLPNKIRAYALQDQGHDTLDANLLLGLPADARTYEMCKVMLDHLGIQKINLITNNPAKIEALTAMGLNVVERTSLHVGENPYNAAYLETKQSRMRHLRG